MGKKMRRVIVCGGREYADAANLRFELDRIIGPYSDGDNYNIHEDLLVITGGAKGADSLAYEWAMSRGANRIIYPADWKKHGNSAGPIRNQEMLDEGKPNLVIAFPGGTGTADMVRRAKAAGVEVIEIP